MAGGRLTTVLWIAALCCAGGCQFDIDWQTDSVAADGIGLGIYVGDGTGQQIVAGLGFEPRVVIVQGTGSEGPDLTGMIRSDTMPAGTSKELATGGSVQSDRIVSLDADGFTVGGDDTVNRDPTGCAGAGCLYYWLALGDAAGVATGTYIGTGSGGQGITTPGFAPAAILVLDEGFDPVEARTTDFPGPESQQLYPGGPNNNRIEALLANGFQVGTALDQNTDIYHYVGLSSTSRVALGSYVGDETARDIPVGFRPELVIVQAIDRSGDANLRYGGMSGPESTSFQSDVFTDRVTALTDDGFTIGTDSQVNNDGNAYWWVAFDVISP